MTSFDRPEGITGNGAASPATTFTYDAGGTKMKMSCDEEAYGIHMDRYYLGGVYEKDENSGENTLKLRSACSSAAAPTTRRWCW